MPGSVLESAGYQVCGLCGFDEKKAGNGNSEELVGRGVDSSFHSFLVPLPFFGFVMI